MTDRSYRPVTAVFPSDDVEVIEGAGDVYRFIATEELTAGSYFMMHAIVPPGGGRWRAA